MTDTKSFASLSPRLLARKGGAKPAMRPQLTPIQFDALARHADDLGWNDMGDDADVHSGEPAEVYPIAPEGSPRERATRRRIAAARRSALDDGRRAAFTLRVDAERHLKLRLACTVKGRSAQQLVTDAIDRLLDELPDVAALAAQIAAKPHKS
ncbi:hypothetical protein B0I00_1673 [Novosphingobium kunmingense]|uniref:Uncharacterized protein n=1 Tax=Novosphingobium kunmingense TaxID=1211806 RepID=A0A2N0HKL3_9SPHN|nr:hypothetical protein [Novosphingobium kunmingense]PKB19439.1 hypothetical protein B0I00_1673 [Novosphingobium kunmingense]